MDWYSILVEYGVSVPDEAEFNILCPFHDDTHLSCSINLDKGVWICFAGCGQGGLKTFIWKLSGKSWDEIGGELETKTWELDFSFSDGLNLEDSSENPIEYGQDLLDVPSNHWIFKRGFTLDIINKWGCKINSYNDLVIPVEDRNQNTLGWLTRRTQAIPKYLYSKGFKKSQALFGMKYLDHVETLFVVEGALDSMWLDQHGYSSVGILGAIISKAQVDLVSSLRPTEVVLCLDNDEAGKRGIKKATVDMVDKFMLSYIDIPKENKDLQEIKNIKTLNKIIKNRTLW